MYINSSCNYLKSKIKFIKKMVHVIFDTSTVGYDDFVHKNPNEMSGGGEISYDYFRGSSPFQRGYGIQKGAGVGDIMRGLWRFFLPVLRNVGNTVKSEAINTGQRVLERVSQGEPIKEAFISEGKKGVDTVLEKGGLPKQFGSGFGRKRGIKGGKLPSYQTLIGKPIKKRVKSDVFGLY